MDLPRVNNRKHESRIKQNDLELAILEAISKLEKDSGYTFQPYEVDNVLLKMIKKNHEYYLINEFGKLIE